MLLQGALTWGQAEALFSLEEYTQAGGTVIYDLNGNPHLSDMKLAQQLQIKGAAEEGAV